MAAVYHDNTSDATVTFRLLLSAPGIDADSATDNRHIPGGDNNFVDLGGQTLNSWEAEGLFSSYADLQAMVGFAGKEGSFTYTEDTSSPLTVTHEVILKKVSRTKVTGRGYNFAKLSFILLT